ncbi:TetR/AcrR family transcriptional regulator [Nocardia amikacinitolerans]|uniref:TetR/AcrR family transcriptional regulator n=1 Tax=Nocardia amikacinitolerans TaxID=756689 RepID=UPI0020A39C13|nr:TetR/AcrR family transcriptional regulator [Nocardia amikacinitolerans]MCP2275736.1 transcriptional regulator, TetR family [Nocardia amikacinitolerans]
MCNRSDLLTFSNRLVAIFGVTENTNVRRTQAERTASTKAALVDATIETIAEIGYYRASLGEICERAGVSKGGLFRHFDSRLALVVEAAEEVGRRNIAGFRALGDAPLADMLALTRSQSRAQINAIWFELLVAARTDPKLREQLAPVAARLYATIDELAVLPSSGAGVDPALLRLMGTSLLHMFDGEAVLREVLPRPELEDARLKAATELFNALVALRRDYPSVAVERADKEK